MNPGDLLISSKIKLTYTGTVIKVIKDCCSKGTKKIIDYCGT